MPRLAKAEDAILTADRFVAKYHAFRTLERVTRDKNEWVVEFDVAILGEEIVRVRLDEETGKITGYEKISQ